MNKVFLSKDFFNHAEKQPSLLIWKDGHSMINGRVAFDFVQNHGLTVDIIKDEVDKIFKKNPLVKAYWVARAYDEKNNTKERFKLLES